MSKNRNSKLGSMGVRTRVWRCGICLSLLLTSYTGRASVKLTVWSHQPERMQKAIRYLLRQFDAKNSKISVKLQSVKNPTSLAQQIDETDLSESSADLFIADSQIMKRWMHKGMLKALDPKDFNVDRVFPIALASMTDTRQTLWGVPISVGRHLMLFVNKKLVSAPYETFESLVKGVKTLPSSKDILRLAVDISNPYWFMPFMSAYNHDGFLRNLPEVNKPALEKAFTLIHDMKFRWGVINDSCDYSCGVEKFLNSEAAMLIAGDWELSKLRNKLGSKLDVVKLPVIGATGNPMRSLAYSVGVYFRRNLSAASTKVATKFVNYLISDSAQLYLMKRSRMLSSVAPISRRVIIKKDWAMSKKLLALEDSIPMVLDPKLDFMMRQIRIQLALVLGGRQQPAAAASFIEAAMKDKYQIESVQ